MKAINDGSSSLAEKFALNVGINVSDVATAVDGGGVLAPVLRFRHEP